MKKIYLTIILLTATLANGATVDFKPQVSTSGSRTVGLDMNGSYSKYRDVSKSFIATVRSTTPVRVVCVLGAVSGNNGVSTKVVIEDVNMQNPLECSISSSSGSYECRLKPWYWGGFNNVYTRAQGVNYHKKVGNARVEGCCVVYEVESGKLVGVKYTSKMFADAFHAEYKQDIMQIIKEEREKLKSNK